MAGNFSDRVTWVGGADALSPTLFRGYAMRTYSGHLRLSMGSAHAPSPQGETGAVHQQVHRRTPRLRPQHPERLGPAVEDAVVRHRQVEAVQLQGGSNQPLCLARRQMKHSPQRQDSGDGERGIGRPPLPVRSSTIQVATTSDLNHMVKLPRAHRLASSLAQLVIRCCCFELDGAERHSLCTATRVPLQDGGGALQLYPTRSQPVGDHRNKVTEASNALRQFSNEALSVVNQPNERTEI